MQIVNGIRLDADQIIALPCPIHPFSGEQLIIRCSTMLAHQPLFSFPLIEDCIGEESCAHSTSMPLPERPKDADDEVAVPPMERRMRMQRRNRRWEMKDRRKVKEYPPLIPSLARTENLHSHMPWVLERTYTADGRLILWEEPVRHHEYFRAHSSDGRLILQLVPLDDEPSNLEDDDNGDDRLHCFDAVDAGNWNETSETKAGGTTKCAGLAADDEEPVLPAAAEAGGGLGKCLKAYNIGGGVNVSGGSSCIFGVAVPALAGQFMVN